MVCEGQICEDLCEPFMTKKTAETENFEGKQVPLSANIQRFFELIVQRVISTLQFWDFRVISPLGDAPAKACCAQALG